MVEALSTPDLAPWTPTETYIPDHLMNQVQKLLLSMENAPHIYIMDDVEYDAQYVGDKLRSWGLPPSIVVAAYLWSYDKEQIHYSGIDEVNEVLRHIAEANLYIRS